MKKISPRLLFGFALILLFAAAFFKGNTTAGQQTAFTPEPVTYQTIRIDGLDIFYREAGKRNQTTILLLHGFPTSSHMFRNLIPALSDKYHVVAPDYPGFGNSSMPTVEEFEYTFDRLAEIVEKFTVQLNLKAYVLYVQDYGAPIGYRLAVKHPECEV